ncbi:MAG TPA: hypothetical protein VH105_16395 [Burkholderiales bacterium]|jgi:hypothetical protein|nr:hypothetical protein [Burkholderiales bacterium]
MPSVDQLKHRLEELLSKVGLDSSSRERKQVARAGSPTELRLLSTNLRDLLGKRFGDRWNGELDAIFGKTTVMEDPPSMPVSQPPSDTSDMSGPQTRFGTQETYTALKQQSPGERIGSLRAYLSHAARELLADKSAPMEQKIASARSINELRGIARAMAEIARLSHSEVTVDRFTHKVQALFAVAEEHSSH